MHLLSCCCCCFTKKTKIIYTGTTDMMAMHLHLLRCCFCCRCHCCRRFIAAKYQVDKDFLHRDNCHDGNPSYNLHWLRCRCFHAHPWCSEGNWRWTFWLIFISLFRKSLVCWCPGLSWPSSAWSSIWSNSLETWSKVTLVLLAPASLVSLWRSTSSLSSGLTGSYTI